MSTCFVLFRRAPGALLVTLLAACGGGGYGGGGDSNPPATLTISVEPTTITLGESATVTWNTNGASCVASGAWSGTKGASGSETVTPTETGMFTYTLVCSGGGYREGESRSATLTVNPGTGFTRTVLVSGFGGSEAVTTDLRLVSPKAIAFGRGTPVLVVGPAFASAYDGKGNPHSQRRVFALDAPTATMLRTPDVSAMVANNTASFVIQGGGKPAPAEFIFADRGGLIGAWSGVTTKAAIVHVADDGAVYQGLSIASDGQALLFATDFRNNKIDVFDSAFRRQAPGAQTLRFDDPAMPADYAPFGIQAIGNGPGGAAQIYVSYARRASPDGDSVTGAGLGLINVFDIRGRLLRRLVSPGGVLDAPLSIAVAPADFGHLGNALLIANSGDGRINAFDPASGAFRGTLSDPDGRPLVSPGLRSIAFGNDSHGQPHNTLFFVAATDDTDGTYGRIDVGAGPVSLDVDN